MSDRKVEEAKFMVDYRLSRCTRFHSKRFSCDISDISAEQFDKIKKFLVDWYISHGVFSSRGNIYVEFSDNKFFISHKDKDFKVQSIEDVISIFD